VSVGKAQEYKNGGAEMQRAGVQRRYGGRRCAGRNMEKKVQRIQRVLSRSARSGAEEGAWRHKGRGEGVAVAGHQPPPHEGATKTPSVCPEREGSEEVGSEDPRPRNACWQNSRRRKAVVCGGEAAVGERRAARAGNVCGVMVVEGGRWCVQRRCAVWWQVPRRRCCSSAGGCGVRGAVVAAGGTAGSAQQGVAQAEGRCV